MKRVHLWLAAFLVAGLILMTSHPARAHKVKLFAAAQGAEISGYAYYPGGGRVKGQPVQVRDAQGVLLAETRTTENGEFSLRAEKGVDHHLTLDLGDGHLAKLVIKAEELPESLPRPKGAKAASSTKAKPTQTTPLPVKGVDKAELTALIQAATAKAVRPLREELAELKERIGMRDVVGGIGYIFGLMGLYLWYASRRKTRPGAEDKD